MAKRNIKDETSKIECVSCRKQYSETQFYVNDNDLLNTELNKKTIICKKCIQSYIGEKDTDQINRIVKVLALLDKPFDMEFWLSESCGETWAKYVTQISSLPQHKGKSFKDSDFINTSIKMDHSIGGIKEENKNCTIEEGETFDVKSLKLKWTGFEENEIPILEDNFQKLIATYPCDTAIQENGYKHIAIIQLMAHKAILNGKVAEYEKLMNTQSKLMTDLKVKPVQENSAEDGGLATWGQWIQKIELEEPIPEAKEEWKDVDGIKKYFNKWFVQHFARIFGLANDFDNREKSEERVGDE